MHTFLDISRLLHAAWRATPTGIDRVELAYARRIAGAPPGTVTFVAEIPLIGFTALPGALVRDMVAQLHAAWDGGGPLPTALARRLRLAQPFGRGALLEAFARPGHKVFLLVSHRALDRPVAVTAIRRHGCHFVPLIHDLIPLQHPEYARPGQREAHRARVQTTATLADAVIVNSAATEAELKPWLALRPEPLPIAVAPLGVAPPQVALPPVALRPYFVILGTIEPRKNHLLLLNLWRQFAASLGAAAPRLVVVGRRGWENENILDMLDRCAALDGLVREAGSLPDREVASLLRGARALLFPSFAEGFGLPLAEALALGVPAICSDLPALREVGQKVPDYLDPLDGAAWRAAVLDYARPDSLARRNQLNRMPGWRAPTWDEHFAKVEEMLASLGAPSANPASARHAVTPRSPALLSARRDEGPL